MEQSKKSFLRNMVGFSMVTWISFAIGFIATPIGTRLFPTAEWGKLNLFHTLSSLGASVCYLGLDQAFVRFFREPPGRASRRAMATFCLASALGFALISSLAVALGWKAVSAKVMGEPDAGVYVCLCFYSFFTVMFRFLSLCYRMEQNAKLYTLQGVLNVVVTKLAYLATGFADARAKPAILTLTALTGALNLVFLLAQRKRFALGALREIDRPFVRQMAAFAAPLLPLTVFTWLNGSISQLVLESLLGFSAVGVYSSALGLASTVNIIQSGFNAYWAPYVYENYQKDDKRRFFTVHRLMACLLTLFALTVTLLQTPVFLLLGEKYRSSVVFFPFLFLTPVCYCLGETTGMGINISKKSYWTTLVFLVSALASVALCYLLIPPLGATGAAVASAGSATISFALRTYLGERYYKAISDYRYAVYTLALTAAAATVNYLLSAQALAKYAALLAIYALALWLFRRELKLLWDTARQVLREGAGALRRKAGGQP